MDEKFLNEIPKDLIKGTLYIHRKFELYEEDMAYTNEYPIENYHLDLIDLYSLLEVFLTSYGYEFTPLNFNENTQNNIQEIKNFFLNISSKFTHKQAQVELENSRLKYQKIFNTGFSYEFTKGDFDRIQFLLNELRDIITSNNKFEPEHKQRLLKRLEKLQSELHKKVSDMDKFWGLLGDAGIAIGKFGNDAKPIVDRIREITNIVWNTQSKTEELPSNFNMPFIKEEN